MLTFPKVYFASPQQGTSDLFCLWEVASSEPKLDPTDHTCPGQVESVLAYPPKLFLVQFLVLGRLLYLQYSFHFSTIFIFILAMKSVDAYLTLYAIRQNSTATLVFSVGEIIAHHAVFKTFSRLLLFTSISMFSSSES